MLADVGDGRVFVSMGPVPSTAKYPRQVLPLKEHYVMGESYRGKLV